MRDKTLAAYDRYWDAFEAWCYRWQIRLPASTSNVTRWVMTLDTLAPNTRMIACAAIAFGYRRRRWRDITRDPHLIAFLRGLRSFEANVTPPIPIVWVIMAIEACETSYRGRRDAALLAIILVTGALPAALCALDKRDYHDEGDRALLRFGDRMVPITAGKTGIVLGAVHAHCRSAGDGPLFRSTNYGGAALAKRMNVKSVYNVVRSRLRGVGAPQNLSSSRAIRAGFIDAARASGVGNVALMRRLGLRSSPWQARWR